MLDSPGYRVSDPAWARSLVSGVGWGLLVSATPAGPVASHLPLLVEEAGPDDALVVRSHLGRPDDVAHDLAAAARERREVLVTVEGPSGYVSPSWYGGAVPAVPTWNFLAVHLWGVPEILAPEDTYRVLTDTVDRFEGDRPEPWHVDEGGRDGAYAHRLAPGTVGFRLRATRWQAKAKLSQDKPPEVVARIVAALESDPVHGNRALAAAMRAAHGLDVTPAPAPPTAPPPPTAPAPSARGGSAAGAATDPPHHEENGT